MRNTEQPPKWTDGVLTDTSQQVARRAALRNVDKGLQTDRPLYSGLPNPGLSRLHQKTKTFFDACKLLCSHPIPERQAYTFETFVTMTIHTFTLIY
jgi:hypothetical protein